MYLKNKTRQTPPPLAAPVPLHPAAGGAGPRPAPPRPPVRREGEASRPAYQFSPQLLFDGPAGLFGRGHHRGSRRGLVLQDSLDGPVRGRRGRHCGALWRLAQGRCWRGVPEEKGRTLQRPSRRPWSPGWAKAAAPAVAETTTGVSVTTQ